MKKICLMLGIALLFDAIIPKMVRADNPICYYGQNMGKVSRIYPTLSPASPVYNPQGGGGTFFSLKNGVTSALSSPNNYYFIPAGGTPARQAVYNSMSDLLLEAAKSGKTVYVRVNPNSPVCNGGGPATTAAEIEYIVVDY